MILLFIIILLFISNIIHGQENQIVRFQGGHFNLSFGVSGPLLVPDGRLSRDHDFFLSSNADSPDHSFDSFPRKNTFLIEASIPFQFNIGSVFDIDNRIDTFIDSEIRSRALPDAIISTPRGKTEFHQPMWIRSLGFQTAVGKFKLSGGYHRSLDFFLNFISTGFSSNLRDDLTGEDGSQEVIINNSLESILRLNLKIESLYLMFGKSLLKNAFIFSKIRYHQLKIEGNGAADIAGTILLGGQEHAFNDETDPWHNDLNQSFSGEYRGSGWGVNLGAFYKISETLIVGTSLDYNFPCIMKGQLDLVRNKIPALDVSAISGKAGEDFLDVSKLKLTQLTLTESIQNVTYPEMKCRMPSLFELNVIYRFHELITELRLKGTMNGLSLQYGRDRMGIGFSHGFSVGCQYRGLRVEGGLIRAFLFDEKVGGKVESKTHFILPQAMASMAIRIREDYLLRLSLSPLPFPEVRCGVVVLF